MKKTKKSEFSPIRVLFVQKQNPVGKNCKHDFIGLLTRRKRFCMSKTRKSDFLPIRVLFVQNQSPVGKNCKHDFTIKSCLQFFPTFFQHSRLAETMNIKLGFKENSLQVFLRLLFLYSMLVTQATLKIRRTSLKMTPFQTKFKLEFIKIYLIRQ